LYGKVLNYLAIRPRSEWEVSQYLKKHHSPAILEKQILSKLSNNGLLDDSGFAKAWVENRRLLKPVSRRRLLAELRAKRISGEVIHAVLEED
jgi:regulatory protein